MGMETTTSTNPAHPRRSVPWSHPPSFGDCFGYAAPIASGTASHFTPVIELTKKRTSLPGYRRESAHTSHPPVCTARNAILRLWFRMV
jgi:hypothetical protein